MNLLNTASVILGLLSLGLAVAISIILTKTELTIMEDLNTTNPTQERCTFLSPDDPAVEEAFNLLPGGPVAFNDKSFDRWQYMGTVTKTSGIRRHEFRHRHHPATGLRRYVHFVEIATLPAEQQIPNAIVAVCYDSAWNTN